LANEENEEPTSVPGVSHNEDDARGRWQEARMKHGLDAPNPDDLISRNRHSLLAHLRVEKAERGARLRERESLGRESIFMLLADA